MQAHFVVYDPNTGCILRSGHCAPDCWMLQARPHEAVLLGSGHQSTHYVDLERQTVVAKPARPSEAYVWDYKAREWWDPRTLDDHRAARWEHIKARRDAELARPLRTEFGLVDFHANARAAIARLAQAAQIRMAQPGWIAPGSAVHFTLADNTVAALSSQQVLDLAIQVDHVEQRIRRFANLQRDRISQATSVGELEAITWPAAGANVLFEE
jgi:hypothetical protein